MGLTCKPIGKKRGSLKRIENEVAAEKAARVQKKSNKNSK